MTEPKLPQEFLQDTTAAYACNGVPIAASAFYAVACDPRRSVVVEACAGAGKTWMLVSRIIRALLEGADAGLGASNGTCATQPHEILAITFTRRAASEMRGRLYEWLTEFAHADAATLQRELQQRGVGGLHQPQVAQRLGQQLAQLYSHMLGTGRTVQIRTFHSWFAALLGSAPVAVLQALQLPVQYELLEDDSRATAQLWPRFYAALVAQPDLKADFQAVVTAYGRFQTQRALQAVLNKRAEFTLADAAGVLDACVQPVGVVFPAFAAWAEPDDMLRCDAAARNVLLQAAQALMRHTDAPSFVALGEDLAQALTNNDPAAMHKALCTQANTARKFAKKMAGIEQVSAAQDLVLRVHAARQQHEAWGYQQRMARLTRCLLAQFAAIKREHGWIDMHDVERAALAMLGDPVLSGWVQEKLDARIKHLLIDEFQDTNPLQWQALLGWLSSYAGAAQAPSVFLVGDPKQSIYRFRRAEPQVFRAAQQFVQQGLGGDLLSCDHTRRNAQQVVATVNTVMQQAQDGDGYEGFRPHTTQSQDAGAVLCLPPIARQALTSVSNAVPAEAVTGWRNSLTTPRQLQQDTLRTLEARQVAAWVAEHLRQGAARPADVMVLSRKRAGLWPLLQALQALGITAHIGDDTALIDTCEVQDVVALLDVLVSPQHDLSLARALRSPLFGWPDTFLVLLACVQRQQPALAWFQILQQPAAWLQANLQPHTEAGLLQRFLLQLQAANASLACWKIWLDALPPHDALQAIYDHGDVLARFAVAAPASQQATVLANLRALLSACLAWEGGRYVTPYALVRALKAGGIKAPASANSQALRLLTVHGAKGLEAQTVVLLDTDAQLRAAESMLVLVDWPGQAAAPEKFIFLTSEKSPPSCALATLQAEQQARQREELNALYVALTRARNTLVISSTQPHRPNPASWWQRLHTLAQPCVAPGALTPLTDASLPPTSIALQSLPTLENTQKTTQELVLKSYFATKKIALEGAQQPQSPQEALDAVAQRVGQAMHRLLEWGVWGPLQQELVVAEFDLLAEQGAQAAHMAQRIQTGQGAWAWDAARLAWQGNEVELQYQGLRLRLDRLVQRCDPGHEGHWWVLDYKTSATPHTQPALREQLQTYQQALQAAYPGQTVKAAFLTGQGELVVI